MIWGVDAQLTFREHDVKALDCSGQSCKGNNSAHKMPIMPTLEMRVVGGHWLRQEKASGVCRKSVHKIQSHVQAPTGCRLSSVSYRSACCSRTRHLQAESLTASLAFLSASAGKCWVQLSVPLGQENQRQDCSAASRTVAQIEPGLVKREAWLIAQPPSQPGQVAAPSLPG